MKIFKNVLNAVTLFIDNAEKGVVDMANLKVHQISNLLWQGS